jgi:hypothetical protein
MTYTIASTNRCQALAALRIANTSYVESYAFTVSRECSMARRFLWRLFNWPRLGCRALKDNE